MGARGSAYFATWTTRKAPASTTPTSVRRGKCHPLATICVPMSRSTSRAEIAGAAAAAGTGRGSAYERPSQRGSASVIAGTNAINSRATNTTARYLMIGRATRSTGTWPTAQAV